MKQLICLLILVTTFSINPSAYGQNWNTDSLKWSIASGFGFSSERYLSETVAINDTIYRSMYYNPSCTTPAPELCGYVRQDGDKIYFRGIDGPPEVPLYDFSLEAGDIWEVGLCLQGGDDIIVSPVGSIQVTAVDSVETLSGMRKRIWFGGQPWIEGLGATSGPLEYTADMCTADLYFSLNCVLKNDTLLYSDQKVPSCCFYELGASDSKPKQTLFAAPNPVDADSPILLFGEGLTANAILYDSAGRRLAEWKWNQNQSINLQPMGVRTGLYYLHLQQGSYSIVQKLVVK